ncbi:MAG: DUF4271 domain-containing protein [Muribaculaceae bacterium]|nr:DUF4271 domain-containing protein [Muribaculaceae bacterium]
MPSAINNIPVADTLPPLNGIAPWTTSDSENDAPWSATDMEHTQAYGVVSHLTGMEGTARPTSYGENSWLSSVVVAMLILLALNFNNYRRLFKNFAQDLVGMRSRNNAFDERSSNDTVAHLLIVLMLCLSEGVLLFTSKIVDFHSITNGDVFVSTMIATAITMALYTFQIAGCKIIGYTFVDETTTTQWIRGFNASQSLLSAILIVPALIALYYPTMSFGMFVIGCVAYILARIFFLFKGFRIFYRNLSSLLYFILYLCTLEITPVIIIARVATNIQ